MLTRAMNIRAFYRQFVFVLFEQSQLHPLPFDYGRCCLQHNGIDFTTRDVTRTRGTTTKRTNHISMQQLQQQYQWEKIQNINQSNNQSIIQSIKREKVCLNGFNFFFHSFVRLRMVTVTIWCCTMSKVMQENSFRGTKRLCLNEFKFEISVTCNFQTSLIWFFSSNQFSHREFFILTRGKALTHKFECKQFGVLPPFHHDLHVNKAVRCLFCAQKQAIYFIFG